jgi:serine/threonine-protein kinase
VTPPPLVTPPPARRRKRRGLRVTVLVVALLLGTGIAYTALHSSNSGADSSDAATVGTTTASGPVTTRAAGPSVAELTNAPDLIGKKLADAQDLLPPTIEVAIIDSVQQGAPAGTVVAQDPAPDAPLHGKIRITVARDPVQLYLDEWRTVNGQWSTTSDPVSIAGKQYLHSLDEQLGGYCGARAGEVEYNLSKGFRRLTATGGIDDNARISDAKAQLEIYGDGRKLTSLTMEFGKPTPIELDVSGVLRLKFHWQIVAGTRCSFDGYLVLGEATLFGLPGEVPTSAAPTS